MTIPKRFWIPAAAGVVVLALAGAGTAALAAHNQPGSLAQKIADTFHLDANKVQGVIDQHHAGQQTKREQKYEDKLNAAVASGQLTSSQKGAILTEHNQLKGELSGAPNLNQTDRRALMQKVRSEAQTWSQQNNLPVRWLAIGPGGFHGHHMHQINGAPAPSPSPSA